MPQSIKASHKDDFLRYLQSFRTRFSQEQVQLLLANTNKIWKPLRKYLTTSSGQLPPQSYILDLIGLLDPSSEHLERKPNKGDNFW